jgi:hypothetical protein
MAGSGSGAISGRPVSEVKPIAESLLLDDVRQLQPAGLLLGDLVFECS